MAANPEVSAAAEQAEPEGGSPYPGISPEARLMKRSIPYFPLCSSGPRPRVATARPRVDCRNRSYQRPTGDYDRRVVAACKADYSHVTSKIDTGRCKSEGDVVQKRNRSATISDSTFVSSQFSFPRKKPVLGRLATHPHIKLPSMSYSNGNGGYDTGCSRKLSAPIVSQRARRPVRSRVDCSDPHPEVTRQSHSLQELQIVPDTLAETLNPRFQLSHTPTPGSSARLRKHSLPTEFVRTGYNSSDRQVQLKRRATDTSIVTTRGGLAALENSIPLGGMEGLGEVGEAHAKARVGVRSNGEESCVVKSKPSVTQKHYENGGFSVNSSPHAGHSIVNGEGSSSVGHRYDNDPDYQSRDSVSSSESVGINPEYTSMDVDTNAFSAESEEAVKLDECSTDGGWERDSVGMAISPIASDQIVGFEVSTDNTQTTVNLLHLLGNKNKSVMQVQTDYQDGELWSIKEEQEEDESDDEMEEEINLSDMANRGGSEDVTVTNPNPQPVPELFIVDENDTVIEKIKTGRRRSRGSLSDSVVSSPPSTPTDCPLNLHALTIHD